jgi:hypothetical protein
MREPFEYKMVLPAQWKEDAFLDAGGRPCVPFSGRVYCLDEKRDRSVVQAKIVEELNAKKQYSEVAAEIMWQLLVAAAHDNGPLQDCEPFDPHEQDSLTVASYLLAVESCDMPDRCWRGNMTALRRKLLEIAERERLDVSDWYRGHQWFAKQVKEEVVPNLQKAGAYARNLRDGHKTWEIGMEPGEDAHD